MRIFLFDMDGTLLHLNLSQQVLDLLREKMFSMITRTIGDPGTKSIFGMYSKALTNPSTSSEVVSELRAMIDDAECQEFGNLSVNTALMSSVVAARAAGVKTGLVTNNGRRLILELNARGHLRLNDFDAVVTRDDVSDIKPSPVPLETALSLLGASKDDHVLFIGDSPADEQSAIRHNVNGTPTIEFEHVKNFSIPTLH